MGDRPPTWSLRWGSHAGPTGFWGRVVVTYRAGAPCRVASRFARKAGRAAVAAMALAVVGLACRPGEPPRAAPPPRTDERAEPVVPEAAAPVKLGVILPGQASADLRQYGELIRQGIDLAVSEYRTRTDRPIELVVKEDNGDPGAASRAAAALEAEGAVAIVGPLLSRSLDAAAANRSATSLVIVSPTATERPELAANAYSLNVNDTRGAAVLASWAIAAGHTRLGVLYATTAESASEVRAFTEQARRTGAQVVAELPFDPGTTTFAGPVQRLKAARAGAVFVTASERDIRQLAPQFAYYGLSGVQILGGQAWVSEEVLRSVPASALEGVVAATPLLEDSPEAGWSEFVRLYERTHRRSLDNPYPALGYDAANLVLRQIEAGRIRPADLAEAVAGLQDYRGATGVLSLLGGEVSRRPFLVRIRAGKTEPLAWVSR